MDNQTQKKPMTAARRGITGAIAGEVVMIVIFILVAASGAQVSFAYALIYLLFGPIYGFGFTFANWRLVAEKTKRGAVEGGASAPSCAYRRHRHLRRYGFPGTGG